MVCKDVALLAEAEEGHRQQPREGAAEVEARGELKPMALPSYRPPASEYRVAALSAAIPLISQMPAPTVEGSLHSLSCQLLICLSFFAGVIVIQYQF